MTSRDMARNPERLVNLEAVKAPERAGLLAKYKQQGYDAVRYIYIHGGNLMSPVRTQRAALKYAQAHSVGPVAAFADTAYEAYTNGFYLGLEDFFPEKVEDYIVTPAWEDEEEETFLPLSSLRPSPLYRPIRTTKKGGTA